MPTESELEIIRWQSLDELFDDTDVRWPVPPDGFRWETLRVVGKGDGLSRANPRRVLTADPVPDAVPGWPAYSPPLRAGLFLDFASTPPTEEGILGFANRWGFLGEDMRVRVALPKPGGGVRHWQAETKFTWVYQINGMRKAVRLWRLASDRDERGIGQVLQWGTSQDGTPGWVYVEAHDPEEDGSAVVFPLPLPDSSIFRPDDPFTPALHMVQGFIIQRIARRVTPMLVWDRSRTRLVLRLYPGDLLGAMGLQFARAVAGEVKYRACKVCGRWLTLSTEDNGFRSDREFCSAACRQKDHRIKVKEARRLKADGRTVRQIAKHFDTTTDTIRNWLSKEK